MGEVGVFKDNKCREAETANEKRNWHESGQRGSQLPDQAGEANNADPIISPAWLESGSKTSLVV